MSALVIAPVSIEDVKRLADIAVELDELKNRLPAVTERIELLCIVGELHDIAEALDAQNGFGFYASGDSAAQEAA